MATPIPNCDGAGSAPFDDQPEQQRKLVRTVLEKLVLKRGVEIAKPSIGEAARLVYLRPSVANGDTEILGDAFGEVD
jgi:hypothetical protein